MNVTRKTEGVLNELEKAHIYIEHPNDSLKEKDGHIAELTERLTRIEKLLSVED
ncbi:MAG: hypothetical protein GY769_11525 [bacterium]|nr:hypothetical protein [bacterium]